ncbi:hypothetical protein EIO_1946 [Ketogulonicigenium vulgare Y25]|uniref:Uncharacterized protein n=2 Tax=Ketogulonicigenium vulgare TaxID=92945 RepID=F9Y8R8_KETVW|nr:hypothetical protein EIO_1946 [Ketogulonicigenium vulgare Y25]AEM41237.1 hypothetical protein KVU_1398 [Ketogulonicigenium vulgare WSH-001]ALJ81379.1 hypothetical protein KVH_09405 [Ketogulonicigenium vulgare]ANW35075.1 hypothetical protein KvSKV_09355 [Ketogulonicigenium vulgare]AOZ54972.1 hypothetical protein KVC_1965 [Ketogulonicigenium vulgare]
MRLTVWDAGLAFRDHTDPVEKTRQQLLTRRYPVAPKPTEALHRLCTITEEVGPDGFSTNHLIPRRNAARTHTLYIHGGAYVLQLLKPH